MEFIQISQSILIILRLDDLSRTININDNEWLF